MTRTRPCTFFSFASAAAIFASALLMPGGMAVAQERNSSGNFLDNLFSRGEPAGQQRQAPPQQAPAGRVAQADPGDLTVRLDRMENALRQLTGTIEKSSVPQPADRDAAQAHARRHRISLPAAGVERQRAAARAGRANESGQCTWRPARQSRPPLRRLRSITTSKCARRAARPRQSGDDRCARARARQRPG